VVVERPSAELVDNSDLDRAPGVDSFVRHPGVERLDEENPIGLPHHQSLGDELCQRIEDARLRKVEVPGELLYVQPAVACQSRSTKRSHTRWWAALVHLFSPPEAAAVIGSN
jgi:hypothetical protein